ncbi:hypothetical protein ATANTOWER_028454 [Ataeniobius toweri]|uniref:Uncharacterized protein n=1 Tax=Ataeniobius toweri TaxID=208326 RepID=A0ABU7BX70_9TELE|nr:hypothetical protein [Ataeniobius toweri]
MSSVHRLREFIRERLTAAAEEIFSEVEKTIEDERRLLEICWRPQIKLHRVDIFLYEASFSYVMATPAATQSWGSTLNRSNGLWLPHSQFQID